MSKLALGTVQFGVNYGVTNKSGQVKEYEIGKILNVARRGGVRTLDTAASYGNAEARLGAFDLSEFQIISKIPDLKNAKTASQISILIEKSLARLEVDSIYAVMLHRVSNLASPFGSEIWEQLQSAKSNGLIRKIGYSLYAPDELDLFFRRFPADIIQVPFNFLDRRFMTTGWMQSLSANGVELHVRSLFLQGVLLAPQPLGLPQWFSPWIKDLDREFCGIDQKFNNRIAYCLGDAVNSSLIHKAVIGVETANHLEEVLSAESLAQSEGLRWIPLGFEPSEKLINPANWSI